uniref:CNNM transmembrane domain-containing protein n=1 Tax=Chenopodium quinoa TaxID=63459 RepID=A0A803MKU0_CHEQI
MHALNSLAMAWFANTTESYSLASEIDFGTISWFVYAGLCVVLVLFAGLMSGLTLGLMSFNLVDLEILARSGTPNEQQQAACILPVVKKQHQLLVTLLLCNAAAMETLPLYLDKLFNQYVAIILSVTLVLSFGEVIPQAICTRYGLAVGANFIWIEMHQRSASRLGCCRMRRQIGFLALVMELELPHIFPPQEYAHIYFYVPIVLDCLLGHNEALFRRAQLKALVSIHGEAAGKGGELTHDETTIINGALDLTEKTAEEAMTPIESTFALDANSKLDWETMGKIQARGHSRVPVYSGNPKNFIGMLLTKSLLTVRPETDTPVSAVSIRNIPRVPADMPLYDILNEFQKGQSHMAAVVKGRAKSIHNLCIIDEKPKRSNVTNFKCDLATPLLSKQSDNSESIVDIEIIPKTRNKNEHNSQQDYALPNSSRNPVEHTREGEVIGIITLEDVFEEILQEEIVDETDEYVDVHKRIRVAAVTAASLVARAPSLRRLTSQKNVGQGSHNRLGKGAKKPGDESHASTK